MSEWVRRDAGIVAAVSAGHFYSHYGILVLPPLFPVLRDVFAVSYTELGLALACLNLTTMVLQAPCGVLVDRAGGFKILLAGHWLMALAIGFVGVSESYTMLLVLMLIAGVGNAVYHPADYSILSNRVDGKHMGRAFSIHAASGHFGFAAAPFLVVLLEGWLGWQWALILSGFLGVLIGFFMLMFRQVLDIKPSTGAAKTGFAAHKQLLFSFPVLAALVFFTMISVCQGGIAGFSTSSLALLHELDLQAASLPLTLFLTLSAIGVLSGGWFSDVFHQHALVCSVCYVLIAVLILPVAFVTMPFAMLLVLFALAGFANGFLSPARDLLVRSVTPEGRFGVVFGFVTTGFNLGGLIAPVLFGAVLDYLDPGALYIAIAVACLVTVLTVVVGQRGQAPVAAHR